MKNTNRTFDVDFAPCDCKGTLHNATHMQVIPVRWKRTDKSPNGRVRFQCMRCKASWSMNDVPGGVKPRLDARHPEEVARRKAIHPYYDEVIAVNMRGGNSQAPGIFPGAFIERTKTARKPGHE